MSVHPVPVMCDWTTGSHRYRQPVKPFESGRILKVSGDGEIEWESQDWEKIRCSSSDTSIRIRCDGKRLQFSGNIGRFQRRSNETGIGVVECMDRWVEVLGPMGVPLAGFGASFGAGSVFEWGTTLSRVDLAGNYEVSDYGAWCRVLMMRALGRKHPQQGKYGPTWGNDVKRANWWKAKVYDKAAELQGKRNSHGGATLARFEIQLGSEYLKREGLNYVRKWKGGDMAQIIYGRFAAELLRDTASVEDWQDIPSRLRHHAVLWRDGADLRVLMSRAQFYRVKSRLRDFGVDISIPCNVVALSQRVRVVDVSPVSAMREAA